MNTEGEDLELETRKVLATLSPIKEFILRFRFGIGIPATFSYKKIALQLGISSDEVAQIEADALRDLRQASRSRFLEETHIQAIPEPPEPAIELVEQIQKVEQISPELIKHLKERIEDLEKVNERVFEQLVAELLAQQGFEDVQLVGRNPNTSADIFATQTIKPSGVKLRLFVEVKRWKDKVGIEVINTVFGAMILEQLMFGCNTLMIVSLGGFKKLHKISAEDLELRSIYLRDKYDLIKWLDDYLPNKNGLWIPQWASEN
ncbi:MAG: restriction endonuclease [Candidatus Ranarchaeia archaeon]|jgi:restriction endonuclease Mrr